MDGGKRQGRQQGKNVNKRGASGNRKSNTSRSKSNKNKKPNKTQQRSKSGRGKSKDTRRNQNKGRQNSRTRSPSSGKKNQRSKSATTNKKKAPPRKAPGTQTKAKSKRKASQMKGDTIKRRSKSAKRVKKTKDTQKETSQSRKRNRSTSSTSRRRSFSANDSDRSSPGHSRSSSRSSDTGSRSRSSSEEETKHNTGKKTTTSTAKKSKQGQSTSKKSSQKKVIVVKKSKTAVQDSGKVESMKGDIRILEITVQIKGVSFNILRKMMVTDEIPFTKFARIIVAGMGWAGVSNWEFNVNDMVIVQPPDNAAEKQKLHPNQRYADEMNVDFMKLQSGDKFSFIYGTEQDAQWEHSITIDKNYLVDRKNNNDNALAKAVNHAVVLLAITKCPRDFISPFEFEKAMEMYETDRGQFQKQYANTLGYFYDPAAYNKDEKNEILSIYQYDEANLDPDFVENDKYFSW